MSDRNILGEAHYYHSSSYQLIVAYLAVRVNHQYRFEIIIHNANFRFAIVIVTTVAPARTD